MATIAPTFGNWPTNPGTGLLTFGNNTNVQSPFGAPTQPQSFSFVSPSFPNNSNSNGMFGTNGTAPAVANNVPPLFTWQQVNPSISTPATTPINVFGGNNATTTPNPWNFFSTTPLQQPQQAPQPMVFGQPLQQQSPPPIYVYPNQPQTTVQLQQPQQNVVQQVQPQQQTSPHPPAPFIPQLIPNAQLYKSFIVEKMGQLVEEYRKLESNQLFLGCPNSNPLVGCGTASPQSFHIQQAPRLSYLPCDIGRPSTLALDFVRGVDKKLEAEKNEKDLTTRLLWRNNHNKRYPLKTVSSTDSMLLHDASVRRSWGSTCLSDPYRDRHYLNYCYRSQHQLPDVWSPHSPLLLSSRLNDSNYMKQRTQSWRRGYAGYSYSEKDRRPQLNRFRVDGASFSNLDNMYLSQVRGNTLKHDIDKKWKTLDVNVVRQSNQNRRQLERERDTEKRVQSLQQPSLKTYGNHMAHFSNETDPRDREDSQNVWQWFRQRRQLTGPPLKSHLDDDDLDLYEKLGREANRIRPEKKMVANLPKRFADWKDSQHNINWPIKSSQPPPLLRARIVKSNTRLLAPTRKRNEICKEEVRTLYRNLKKGEIVTQQENGIDAISTGSSSVPLTEKTSPVFLTIWKNDKRFTSSTAIQTDQRCNTGSFTEEDQNDRQSKETREQCTQRLRAMDPYQGRLRGRGPRIGEQSPRTHDETFSPPKEEPSVKPFAVTLSKTGYYCIPNIATLNKMAVSSEWKCVWVKDFEIGHNEHGKAVFPGYTNVYGLDFDKIVKISHKTFELYPEPYKEPPFGKGLNKPCTVTLYNIYPREKDETASSRVIRDPETIVQMKFEDFLKGCCKKFKGTFLKYCPEHGEWVFQVQEGPINNVEQPVLLALVDSNEDL